MTSGKATFGTDLDKQNILGRLKELQAENEMLRAENEKLAAAFAKMTTIKVPRNFPNRACVFLDDFERCSASLGYFCKNGEQDCPLPVLIEFKDEVKP
jgi:hypothetical protein